MSIKSALKSRPTSIRFTEAMIQRAKELNIDLQNTCRQALHREIKKVEKFNELKDRSFCGRKDNTRSR